MHTIVFSGLDDVFGTWGSMNGYLLPILISSCSIYKCFE